MRFFIENEHKSLFETEGEVSFEELFSSDEQAALPEQLDLLLRQRLSMKQEVTLTPEQRMAGGRDLSREDAALRKLVTRRSFADVAAQLVDKRPLRLAYDQVVTAPLVGKTLQEVSCIQGIVCGLILGEETIYIAPDHKIPSEGLLIVYSKADAIYIDMPGDPNKNTLKHLGYAIGDKLRRETHPIVANKTF